MSAHTPGPWVVDGATYTLAQMLEANADDADLCDWLRTAKPGDVFPAFIDCRCMGDV